MNRDKGEKTKHDFEKARSITAMYHFNSYGCKIGKTALDIKKELQDIQKKKQLEARNKEEKDYFEKKEKYEAIMTLNLPDEKLNAAHLKALLAWLVPPSFPFLP